MTLQEAQEAIYQLPFPELAEGDIVWYPGRTKPDQPQSEWGYRFIRNGDTWVHHPID